MGLERFARTIQNTKEMDLTLRRNTQALYGIFGQLIGDHEQFVAVTLEHAFPITGGEYVAIIPLGKYPCQRGIHQLPGKEPFETFEVLSVPKHTGILFHVGNYNEDSQGCILVGGRMGAGCILDSKFAFNRFLDLQAGLDTFELTVS